MSSMRPASFLSVDGGENRFRGGFSACQQAEELRDDSSESPARPRTALTILVSDLYAVQTLNAHLLHLLADRAGIVSGEAVDAGAHLKSGISAGRCRAVRRCRSRDRRCGHSVSGSSVRGRWTASGFPTSGRSPSFRAVLRLG